MVARKLLLSLLKRKQHPCGFERRELQGDVLERVFAAVGEDAVFTIPAVLLEKLEEEALLAGGVIKRAG